jgi:hypothetical protein
MEWTDAVKPFTHETEIEPQIPQISPIFLTLGVSKSVKSAESAVYPSSDSTAVHRFFSFLLPVLSYDTPAWQ